jgi:hypothetical protein
MADLNQMSATLINRKLNPMEFDAFQNYLDALREQRKTPRERELEQQLQEIAERKRRELVAESEPLFKELAEIEAQKPPLPIQVDGKVYEYVGPIAARAHT